jgi:hypothetical protein
VGIRATRSAQTLNIEFDNGSDVIEASVRVPANTVVSLGTEDTEPLLIEDLNTPPGSDIATYFQSGDAEGTLVAVPVLDGGLAYLEPLVP